MQAGRLQDNLLFAVEDSGRETAGQSAFRSWGFRQGDFRAICFSPQVAYRCRTISRHRTADRNLIIAVQLRQCLFRHLSAPLLRRF